MNNRFLMSLVLASAITTAPVFAADSEEKGWWDNIKSYVSNVWTDTEDKREIAADKSRELAKKTKELGVDIAEDTADVTKKVYEEGKEAGTDLWNKTKKNSADLWEKTKEKAEELKEK